jgi:ATP adenylyltransferase
MDSLFSPWRFSYLVQEKTKEKEEGCVFCNAVSDVAAGEDSLVVYRAAHNFIILNLYPYNNGHLMVVPNRHLATPMDSDSSQRTEMSELAVACEIVLRDLFRPDGINLGMNLGRAAGAGIEDHFHLHLVPRWSGDTNFMTVMAGTRVIPEDLRKTCSRVRKALLDHQGCEPGISIEGSS